MKNTQSPEGAAARVAAPPLSISKILDGRGVFILGSTGFVGKVLLSMLLERFPDVGRGLRHGAARLGHQQRGPLLGTASSRRRRSIRCARRTAAPRGWPRSSRRRWWSSTATSPSRTWASPRRTPSAVAKDIDVLINSSGRVTFNPPLESALRTNVEGTKNVIAFAQADEAPGAGAHQHLLRGGQPLGRGVGGRGARSATTRATTSCPGPSSRSSRRWPTAIASRAARIRQQADDAQVLARLRQKARERLRDESRDPDDEGALKLAVARERKEWIRTRAHQARHRARRSTGAGPTSTRTRRAWATSWSRARRASSGRSCAPPSSRARWRYPFPGWNEGFTTSAPLVYLALKGQNVLPVSDKLILDIVPVDHVVRRHADGGRAGRCVEQPKLVHQLASGDLNPLLHRSAS